MFNCIATPEKWPSLKNHLKTFLATSPQNSCFTQDHLDKPAAFGPVDQAQNVLISY